MDICECPSTGIQWIGKLDIGIYSCIAADIITDDVIITTERIDHIRKNHPNDYERFYLYIPQMIEDPDYVIQDIRPKTAIVLKKITDNGEYFRLSLRLATSSDLPEYKNSIITFMKIREKEWRRLLRNKTLLYKKA